MKKVKYHFNRESLQYEKVTVGWKTHLLRAFMVCCAALVFGVAFHVIASELFPSPKDIERNRLTAMSASQLDKLNRQLKDLEEVSSVLQNRDDGIYRTIFEAEPIPDNVRQAGYGGTDRFKQLENLPNGDLLKSTAERVEKLKKRLYIQSRSYDEVIDMLKEKEDMLASIPAIQPVSNKNLKRMASGYGRRIHPIYKTRKMHWGCDFSAPTGTDIYVTGKGKVVEVKKSKRGYGHHVIIDHGYNFKTLYAHMDKIKVRKGQRVNRGDVIGTVGNTGTSTAPHLHYEVIKNGKKIDPINFFYNDLSPEEYEKMLEISSHHNQSFD